MQTARNEKGIARLDCVAYTLAGIQLLVSFKLVRSGGCVAFISPVHAFGNPVAVRPIQVIIFLWSRFRKAIPLNSARREPSDRDGGSRVNPLPLPPDMPFGLGASEAASPFLKK